MNEEVQKSLNRACQYKMTGEYREALKIFDKQFSQNPDEFREIHKTDYAWTIYRVSVQNFRSEDELFESAEFITNLIAQKGITKNKSDPYTSAVFKVINYLNSNEEYYEMPYWLEKINPNLLDENKYKKYGRWNKSKRERFYDLASKTYLQCGDYEKCIEISAQALESRENFVDDADVWYRWRIAKSLFNLNQLTESLEYAIEVTKSKPEWYVYNMIAEIYQRLNKPLLSLEYLCPAILSNVPDKIKLNTYYTAYQTLKNLHKDQALKHAQYFSLLKFDYRSSVPNDIRKLNIDVSQLNKKQLQKEIKEVWLQYQYRGQKPQQGKIIKFFDDKKFGFIRNVTGEEIFFHQSEFFGDSLLVGQNVSFFTKNTFDKVKKQNSLKAVYIK